MKNIISNNNSILYIEDIQRILGLASFGIPNKHINSYFKSLDYGQDVVKYAAEEELETTQARQLVERICSSLDKLAKAVESFPESKDILPKLDCMKELLEEVAEISEGKRV